MKASNCSLNKTIFSLKNMAVCHSKSVVLCPGTHFKQQQQKKPGQNSHLRQNTLSNLCIKLIALDCNAALKVFHCSIVSTLSLRVVKDAGVYLKRW